MTQIPICHFATHFLKTFFLMNNLFYYPCKFITPQGSVLQELKTSEAKKSQEWNFWKKKITSTAFANILTQISVSF